MGISNKEDAMFSKNNPIKGKTNKINAVPPPSKCMLVKVWER